MAFRTQTPSASLIHAARSDASRNVAKWRWTLFGVILSIVPIINIVLIGISTIVLSTLTPTIDLSTPQRQALYFEKSRALYAGISAYSKAVTVHANFLWLACRGHHFKSFLKEG